MDSVLLKAQELSYSYHTLNGETPALDRVSFPVNGCQVHSAP